MTRSVEGNASVVAFGGWRCNCTMLAQASNEVPAQCPTHSVGLLGPVSWVRNTHNVALGLVCEAGYRT